MSQYQHTNTSVTNGDATVTMVGVDATGSISVGDWFGVAGTGVMSYQVAGSIAYAAGNTTFELTTTYSGTTATGATGIIQNSFTTNYALPVIARSDLETAALMGRLATEIDDNLFTEISTIDGGTF